MNRERAKELLPVITAFANGETVQFYNGFIWVDDGGYLNFYECPYRIKPKPVYKPHTMMTAISLVGQTIYSDGNPLRVVGVGETGVFWTHSFHKEYGCLGYNSLLNCKTEDSNPVGVLDE